MKENEIKSKLSKSLMQKVYYGKTRHKVIDLDGYAYCMTEINRLSRNIESERIKITYAFEDFGYPNNMVYRLLADKLVRGHNAFSHNFYTSIESLAHFDDL